MGRETLLMYLKINPKHGLFEGVKVVSDIGIKLHHTIQPKGKKQAILYDKCQKKILLTSLS